MSYNTIILKNYGNNFEEYNVAAVLTPGMLVETDSDDAIQPHSTANGAAAKLFAIENALEGEGIDDAYAVDDKARVWACQPGDEVYALILDGENIAIGDKLVSAGNGRLKERRGSSSALVEDAASIIAEAREALDLSSSSGAETTYRCRVRII